jgi:hypothetical protein
MSAEEENKGLALTVIFEGVDQGAWFIVRSFPSPAPIF